MANDYKIKVTWTFNTTQPVAAMAQLSALNKRMVSELQSVEGQMGKIGTSVQGMGQKTTQTLQQGTQSWAKFGGAIDQSGRQLDLMGIRMTRIGIGIDQMGRMLTRAFTIPVIAGLALSAKAAFDFQKHVEDLRVAIIAAGGDASIAIKGLNDQSKKLNETLGGMDRGAIADVQAIFVKIGATIPQVKQLTDEASKLAFINNKKPGEFVDTLRVLYQNLNGDMTKTIDTANQLNMVSKTTGITFDELGKGIDSSLATLQHYNISIGQGATLLALLKQKGFDASEAATTLNKMFVKMPEAVGEAQGVIQNFTSKGKLQLNSLAKEVIALNAAHPDKMIAMFDNAGKLLPGSEIIARIAGAWRSYSAAEQDAFAKAMFGQNVNAKVKGMLDGISQAMDPATAGTNSYAKAFQELNDQQLINANTAAQVADKQKQPAEQFKDAIAKIKNAAITLGTEILPYLTKALDFLGKIFDKFSALSPGAKKAIIEFGLAFATLGPALTIIGKLYSAYGTLTRMIAKPFAPMIKSQFDQVEARMAQSVAKTKAMQAAVGGGPGGLAQTEASGLMNREQAGLSAAELRAKNLEQGPVSAYMPFSTPQGLAAERKTIGGGSSFGSTALAGGLQTRYAGLAPGVQERNPAGQFMSYSATGQKVKMPTVLDDATIASMNAPKVEKGLTKALEDGTSKATQQAKGGRLKSVFSKLTSAIPFLGGGAEAGAGAGLSGMVGSLGALAAAAAPVVLAIGAIAGAVYLIVKNWKEVSKGIGSGLKDVEKAFKGLINTIIGPFKDLFAQMGFGAKKGSDQAKQLSNFWQDLGKVINVVAHIFAVAINIASAIVKPFINFLVGGLKLAWDVLRFVIAILTGDWHNAWQAAKAIVADVVKFILTLIVQIPIVMLDAIGRIVSLASHLPFIGGKFKEVKDAIKDAKKELESWPTDIASKIDSNAGTKAADASGKAGKEVGKKFKDGVEQTPPAAVPDPTFPDPAEANAAGREYVQNFITEFQSSMRKIMDGWKEAALKTYDEWAKAQKDSLTNQENAAKAAIKAQIDALDDLEKKQKEQDQLSDYLAEKDKIRRDRSLMINNYQSERDQAIYEGDYGKAKQLDFQKQKDLADSNQQEQKLDTDHNRQVRDDELAVKKQELQDQQTAIEAQYTLLKQSLDDQLTAKRSALEEQLNAVLEYIPKNKAAAEQMQNTVLATLQSFTPGWRNIAADQATVWGKSWDAAFTDAHQKLSDKAWWAGNDAMKQFAAALGVDVSVLNGTAPAAPAPAPAAIAVNNMAPNIVTGVPYDATPYVGVGSTGSLGPGRRRLSHSGGHVGADNGSATDIPATLQQGEYVVQRRAVARVGTDLLDAINGRIDTPIMHDGGLFTPALGNAWSNMFGNVYQKFMANQVKFGNGKFGYDDAMAIMQSRAPQTMGGNFGNIPQQFLGMFKGLPQGTLDLARLMFGADPSAIITATTNGHHVNNSYHYKGQAVDVVGNYKNIWGALVPYAQKNVLAELFMDLFGGWKDGHSIGAIGGHMDHLHGAIADAFRGGIPNMGGPGPGQAGPVPPGNVTNWLTQALQLTGTDMGWLSGLYKLTMAESGGDPHNYNPRAVGNEHAEGLLQMLPSTFRAHEIPGHFDIYNPVDNASSAIGYIKGRYRTVYNTPLFTKGGAYGGYHIGGLVDIARMASGGKTLADGLAVLHKGETVVDAPLTKQLENHIDAPAGNDFTLHMHFEGGYFGTDRELEKLADTIESRIIPKLDRSRGLQQRTVGAIQTQMPNYSGTNTI